MKLANTQGRILARTRQWHRERRDPETLGELKLFRSLLEALRADVAKVDAAIGKLGTTGTK